MRGESFSEAVRGRRREGIPNDEEENKGSDLCQVESICSPFRLLREETSDERKSSRTECQTYCRMTCPTNYRLAKLGAAESHVQEARTALGPSSCLAVGKSPSSPRSVLPFHRPRPRVGRTPRRSLRSTFQATTAKRRYPISGLSISLLFLVHHSIPGNLSHGPRHPDHKVRITHLYTLPPLPPRRSPLLFASWPDCSRQ